MPGNIRLSALLVAALALLSAVGPVAAQAYPTRPVRLVTAEPGGGNDLTARTIVQALGGSLGQQVVVDNRGGAGGAIAIELVARAKPDGHTLLLYANNIWLIPLLRSNVPYDPVTDFSPITWAARSPSTLVVHPSLPVKSMADLIALAKARPGELNYGSAGTGSSSHLAMELFKFMTGVNVVRVPFKGNGPALNALIAGNVQVMITTTGTASPHQQSGRLRPLAVTSARPTPLAPGLPTVASLGLPGYESEQIYGVYAPAGTAPAILKRINEEFVRVLARPEVKERFFAAGIEVVGSAPEELAAVMKSEMTRLAKVIKAAGISAD
jgi:tripartite-type tricarboxylate transporter receptor subunit TctC